MSSVKGLFFLIILLFLNFASAGQDKSEARGKITGQWRTFYLNTINEGELKDFSALATGLKLGYVYQFNKVFSVKGVFYSSINTQLFDVTISDPFTEKTSRYEAGLFNITDLNQSLVIIPGELLFQFEHKKHLIKLGRMKMVSPLLNPQDGRMIPTLVEGAFYNYKGKASAFGLGLISKVAPRSTNGFYNIGESIGLLPVGRGIEGSTSLYRNNTNSNFIFVQHLNLSPIEKRLKINAWNYYTQNIFNTFYLAPEYNFNFGGLSIEAQWILQNRVGNGGNIIPELRYFEADKSQVFGLRLTKSLDNFHFSASYNRITADGRFLFPREWGREFLFTFQKRERSEGSGDRHAFMISGTHEMEVGKNSLKSQLSLGWHKLPPVSKAELNKYAMEDYGHLNADFFFTHHKLPRLKTELLITTKRSFEEIANKNFVLNKTNMLQFNLIMNYNIGN